MSFPTYIAIFSLSILGLLLVLLRRLPEAARMSPEEIAYIMQTRKSLPRAIVSGMGGIVGKFWTAYLRMPFFTLTVKGVSRIRIAMLKVEQYLFKLTTKIRQRSTAAPRPSHYWQEIYGWRKNLTWRGRGGKKMKVYIPEAERKSIAKELHTDVESLKPEEPSQDNK